VISASRNASPTTAPRAEVLAPEGLLPADITREIAATVAAESQVAAPLTEQVA
jgi:hypothetical protein